MYEYYYLSRPPGIGCQPPGFDPDTRETWVPRRETSGSYYWGKVSYPEGLSHEEICRYNLRPVDQVEYAHHVFWEKDAESWEDEYLAQDLSLLYQMIIQSGSILAQAALVILEAQKGVPDETK